VAHWHSKSLLPSANITLFPFDSIIHTSLKESTGPTQLAALSSALSYIPTPYAAPSAVEPSLGSSPVDLRRARDRGVKVGEAVQNLINDLGLKSTLKGCGLKKEDVELSADRAVAVMGGEKGGERWTEIRDILESVYDD